MLKCEKEFVLRTPLLPIHLSRDLSEGAIKRIFQDPLLKEAIFIASSAVYERLEDFLNGKLKPADSERLLQSLRKYLLRLTHRPTPFGLFASVSVASWSDRTDAVVSSSVKRKTRLDAGYVDLLVSKLLAQEEVASHLRYYPNNTIYKVDEKLRYTDLKLKDGKRIYFLSDVDADEVLHKVLASARDGLDKFSLANTIGEMDVNYLDALGYVEELINNKLLVSELEVRITGTDYFRHVCQVLETSGVDATAFNAIGKQVQDVDRQTPEENLAGYRPLMNKLAELCSVDSWNNFIQTDSFREAKASFSRKISRELERVTEILAGLFPSAGRKNMTDFKREFRERYEMRTMDLCAVLDPEIGLGYPVNTRDVLDESDLLSSIGFPQPSAQATETSTAFHLFILRKYSEALLCNGPMILDEEEIAPFRQDVTFPSSLYAFVSLLVDNRSEIRTDDDFLLEFKGAYGPSAATLLARFCHLDGSLDRIVREAIAKEEESGYIFAEIVHVNQSRMGNISTRPVLRDYEIPILATAGVDKEHVININDLTLTLADDRLVLGSKRLNREIIPRLTSAHNYSRDTLAVYRFLCDLQFQDGHGSVGWDWGPLKSAAYLPEVRIGKTILSNERWHLSDEQVQEVAHSKDIRETVHQLRHRMRLPRMITLGQEDSRVPIDLEDPHHLSLFRKLVESTRGMEAAPHGDRQWIKDAEGSEYANELIVLLSAPLPVQKAPYNFRAPSASRRFSLGSEWLYYKIYCSAKGANRVLLDVVDPFVKRLLDDGLIRKWFFVRYRDPDHHIRLRVCGPPGFFSRVIALAGEMLGPYLESGLIYKLTTDNYTQEIERYGDDNMADTENVFFIDSECVVDVLHETTNFEIQSWPIALLGIDQLLNAFELDLATKLAVTRESRDQFFSEIKGDRNIRKSMSLAQRNYSAEINSALNLRGLSDTMLATMQRREERIKEVVTRILEKNSAGDINVPLMSLLRSYIHMWVNRVFHSHARHYELVLYDFLYRHFDSQLARTKKGISTG